MSRKVLERLRGLVEFVTDLVFDADGVATSKGLADHPLESLVGWHFGFYSRPKDGARGVVLKADGQGNTSFLFTFFDKQYELTLEKGEVGIQNAFSASILLNKNGEVVVNGGSKKVARVDDTTTNGTIELIGGISTSFGGIKYTAPDGTVTSITASGTPITLAGKIDSGAAKVLA